MHGDVFSEFYRQRGYYVVRSPSAWWYSAHSRFLMSVPYHEEITPQAGEIKDLFAAHSSVIGARYFGPKSGPGAASFLLTCRDKSYDLNTLGGKARNQTRAGLRSCEVRLMTWAETIAAYDLSCETCTRQGRTLEFTESSWRRLCEVAATLPGFQPWGAFVQGVLAAFAIVLNFGHYSNILYQFSRTSLLPRYPNNALTFVMTRDLLSRSDTEVVCYGPEPLELLADLNRFKVQMGYAEQPINQLCVISPRWRAATSPLVHKTIAAMARWTAVGSVFRRAAGVSHLVQATLAASTGVRSEPQC